MSIDNGRSPAAKVMDEAIDLAIEGSSPYPDRAAFIHANTASAGYEIKRAADDGQPVALVVANSSTCVLTPERRRADESPVRPSLGQQMGQRAPRIPAELDPVKTALESTPRCPADPQARATKPKVTVRILSGAFLRSPLAERNPASGLGLRSIAFPVAEGQRRSAKVSKG